MTVGNQMARDVSGINVSGDGVAIGTGNTVVVQKNRITNNNGGHRNSESEVHPLAYGIVGIIVLVIATYFFTKYADEFYAGAMILGGLGTIFPLVSVALQLLYKQPIERPWQESGTFTLSGVLTAFTYNTWQHYPEKLAEIVSQADGPHTFWCALNAYGESVSSENLFAALGMVISLLLLMPHSLRSLTQYFLDSDNSVQQWLGKTSSSGKLIGAAIFMGLTWAMLTFAGPQVQAFMTSIRPAICHGN
ncbi:MAG TPA: hypothetical protein VJR68_06895 [Dyella sp.]|nr:hypothetical protein [Dyella sp.]